MQLIWNGLQCTNLPKVCFLIVVVMSLTNIYVYFPGLSVAWCLMNASVSSFLLYCDSNGLPLKSDRCNSGCQTLSYSHLLRPHVSTGMLCYFCWPLLQLHLLMFTITLNLEESVLAVFPPTHKRSRHFYIRSTKKIHRQIIYFNFFFNLNIRGWRFQNDLP